MPIPQSLHRVLVHAQQLLYLPHREALDPLVLRHIGTTFGALSDQPAGICALQRRHLLLLLLTFRHVVPAVTPHLTQSIPLVQMIRDTAAVIVNPSKEQIWNDVQEHVKWWGAPRLDEQHPQEYCLTGLYVVSKAIESCLTATQASGYAGETHSSVALQYAAETYVACGDGRAPAATRRRMFWQFWLTSIVPRAWYDVDSNMVAPTKAV